MVVRDGHTGHTAKGRAEMQSGQSTHARGKRRMMPGPICGNYPHAPRNHQRQEIQCGTCQTQRLDREEKEHTAPGTRSHLETQVARPLELLWRRRQLGTDIQVRVSCKGSDLQTAQSSTPASWFGITVLLLRDVGFEGHGALVFAGFGGAFGLLVEVFLGAERLFAFLRDDFP